jgi:hypothetical protein
VAAYKIFEFVGEALMSITPVFSSINKTLFQVFPPSEVLKIPRSAFGVYKLPITPTTTSFGLFLLMIILPICCEFFNPTSGTREQTRFPRLRT